MKRLLALTAVAVAIVLGGGQSSFATGASASINGPIIFGSSRAPGDSSLGMLWSVDTLGQVTGPLGGGFDSSQPAFSRDGSKIAFSTRAAPGSGEHIAIASPDGTSFLPVAGHGSTNCNMNEAPTWSPDGRQIAYVTCDAGVSELAIVTLDGSGVRVIKNTGNLVPDVNHPSWSPDGTEIAYERLTASGVPHIFTIHPDGTGDTDLNVVGLDPAYSPDGSQIAFDLPRGGPDAGIWVMNADGSGVTHLTTHVDAEPAWSPDGTQIVFASARDGNYKLWLMNADGSGQTQLTNPDGVDAWPAWGRVPSHDVTISDCNDPRAPQLQTVDGNLVLDVSSCAIDLGRLTTVAGNVDLVVQGPTTVNVGSLATVTGSVTITGGNLTLEPAGTTTVGGNITAVQGGNVDLSTFQAAGDVSLTSNDGNSVSGQTAGGTTSIRITGGVAALHVAIPGGAFTQSVPFTVTREAGEPPAAGLASDGTPAIVEPVAGYRFAFGVPTLNADATLTFTIALSQLAAADRLALLNGAVDGAATVAVRGDAAGSVFQGFPRCAAGQTPAANACVDVSLLDANGQPTTNEADAASVQFDGVAGHFSEYAVALMTPLDTTPPQIEPVVGGTPGGGGFYRSDVAVSWNVQDPESAVTSRSGCDATTVTADTTGETFTCTATSAGGTATKSVTIARDTTAPDVTYAGNGGIYDVDQNVAITCVATDPAPGSGLASSTCADVSRAAWTFGAGTHTLAATAVDVAGNAGAGSTTFSVIVRVGGLCRLTYAFVQASTAYARTPPSLRGLIEGSVAALCHGLGQVAPRLGAAQKAQLVTVYRRGLQRLLAAGYLTTAQASVLGELAGAL